LRLENSAEQAVARCCCPFQGWWHRGRTYAAFRTCPSVDPACLCDVDKQTKRIRRNWTCSFCDGTRELTGPLHQTNRVHVQLGKGGQKVPGSPGRLHPRSQGEGHQSAQSPTLSVFPGVPQCSSALGTPLVQHRRKTADGSLLDGAPHPVPWRPNNASASHNPRFPFQSCPPCQFGVWSYGMDTVEYVPYCAVYSVLRSSDTECCEKRSCGAPYWETDPKRKDILPQFLPPSPKSSWTLPPRFRTIRSLLPRHHQQNAACYGVQVEPPRGAQPGIPAPAHILPLK
jgi:hypothetical protein